MSHLATSNQIKPYSKKAGWFDLTLSHLPTGADEGGLEQISTAPRVLGLPHQVSRRVVDSSSSRGPNLTAERHWSESGIQKQLKATIMW